MSFRNDFRLRPKSRKELGLALRMYGENEEPHLQIENMWEVYSPSTGMALLEPKPDFSEFSRGDRMYPSMMKPDTKDRWEQKNKEWRLKGTLCVAQASGPPAFMREIRTCRWFRLWHRPITENLSLKNSAPGNRNNRKQVQAKTCMMNLSVMAWSSIRNLRSV